MIERLVGEVGERRPAPQRKSPREFRRTHLRRAAPRLVEQPLEPVGVDRIRIDRQPVRRSDRLQHARAGFPRASWLKRSAQPRHETVHDRGRGRGRISSPELVDEPLSEDRLVRVEREEGEQRSAPAHQQLDASSPVQDLHRPQDPELHGPRPRPLLASR